MGHVGRGHELTLLDVDRCAGFAGRDKEVGLSAEERWYLKYIDDFGRFSALIGGMHIREDRAAKFHFDVRKH